MAKGKTARKQGPARVKGKPRVKRGSATRENGPAGRLRASFPNVARAQGLGARIIVVMRTGRGWDVTDHVWERIGGAKTQSRKAPSRRTRSKSSEKLRAETIQALGAAAHRQRVRILCRLLDGSASYADLEQVTGAHAGPLYHHINQLRMSGLLLPKERNVYDLTVTGQRLIAGLHALDGALDAARRRRRSRPHKDR